VSEADSNKYYVTAFVSDDGHTIVSLSTNMKVEKGEYTSVQNGRLYVIEQAKVPDESGMTVYLYNDKADKNGKAMGQRLTVPTAPSRNSSETSSEARGRTSDVGFT
jgi:predicted secreted hydrolase